MKIEFYEEFPNRKNLQKLKLIKFPTKIFIASKSIKDFRKYEKIAKSIKKNIVVAYWPTIKNSYWISPFSNTKDLSNLFEELNSIKTPILIDLELPLIKKYKFSLLNLLSFFRNKKLINGFLEKNKFRITTAEYIRSPTSLWARFLGLHYKVKTEKSLMFYSSTTDRKIERIWKRKILSVKDRSNYSISLGTIASGINGGEPILKPNKLEDDLKFVRDNGFKKVVIFRLEGINQDYIKILNKFV